MSFESGYSPEEAINPDAILAELGLGELADMQIEAHGGVYSVREALVDCPPFAGALRSTADVLEGVPDKSDRLKAWVTNQGANSGESAAAKKK